MQAQKTVTIFRPFAYAPKLNTMIKLVGLHLLPGVLAVLFYLALVPLAQQAGFPPLMALYLGAPLAIVGWELGYLLYQGRRLNGRLSLAKVIGYQKPLPLKQGIGFGLLFIGWALLTSGLFLVDSWLSGAVFSWAPDWFRLADLPHYATLYSRPALLVTFVVGLFLNGLVGPVIEELYFRGYLLPRMNSLGRWAPLLNIALFSLYHFWAPWQIVSRTALLLPWGYFTQWKQNIFVTMVVHCLINTLSMISIFALLLGNY